MKGNGLSQHGGTKKFLYTGPKKGNDDEDDDLPWNFNSKSQKQNNTGSQLGSKFELDDVWSIQRNVNVGGGVKQPPKAESLHYNTNKGYYSRHGGAVKDKDEFGGSFTARNEYSSTLGNSDTGGKSWGASNQSSRRPFSYAFGNESQNQAEKPISPRNISNSSSGVYPQTGGSHFGSQMGSGMNSGNFNSFRGGNLNSQESVSFLNNDTTDRLAGSSNTRNGSVFSKSLSSPTAGANISFNATQRNGLFNSSPQRNTSQNGLFNTNSRSLFEGGSPRRPNKSVW